MMFDKGADSNYHFAALKSYPQYKFLCAIGNRSLYTLGDGTQKLNFR